jgi:hypothetical protein
MKNIYAMLGLAAVIAASSVAAADAPFTIRRSGNAADVRVGNALAVVAQGPFDDAPGVLTDGTVQFYVADDATGAPVAISVSKNLPAGTVRIGFDDENPSSAPVDASSSVITIVPRDAAGVALGSGLDVQIDASALWPGAISGPVRDMGDGSYVVTVVSATPGQGEVWITVEGVALAAQPLLTYEDVGGPGSLRDVAVARIDAESDIGGAFEQLIDGLPWNDSGVVKVERALDKALAAMDSFDDNDPEKDAEAVERELAAAIDELRKALESPGAVDPVAIQSLIDELLDLGRMIAVHYYNEALATCGPCDSGGSDHVCHHRIRTTRKPRRSTASPRTSTRRRWTTACSARIPRWCAACCPRAYSR